MANKHPNTSGLKPFNKMDPDRAKYIQRLGGIAHAKRYGRAEDNYLALDAARKHVVDKHSEKYNPVYDLYVQLYEILYDRFQPLEKRLKALAQIQKVENIYNKYKDDQNALLYKCSSSDYQMSDDYDECFNDEDISFIAASDYEFADNTSDMLKEESANQGSGIQNSCSDTKTPMQ